MTNLIQTISDKDKYIIYYDSDVFNENVTLSIHLTVPNLSNASGPVEFSTDSTVEWNTIYEETFGTSGDPDKLYQVVNGVPQYITETLQEIAVQIWSLPTFAAIEGNSLAPVDSTYDYQVPDDYDPGNIYTYQWRLRKIKNTDTDTTNGRAVINGPTNGRTVNVTFTHNGFVNLELIVTGTTGCPRIIRKQVSVELPLTKMLIIRNRLV